MEVMMIVGITKDTLLKDFLIHNNFAEAFITNGPLGKDERSILWSRLGLAFMSNGDYVIFDRIPTDLSGLRGFVWQNGGLVTIG
jgi:hypothetical protein